MDNGPGSRYPSDVIEGNTGGTEIQLENRQYRTPEVCRLSGATYRQVDYWARTGLITPEIRNAHGSGSERVWSHDDVLEVRMIKRALEAGISVKLIRQQGVAKAILTAISELSDIVDDIIIMERH